MRYGESKARIIGTWAGGKDCLLKSFCSNYWYRSLYFSSLGLQIKNFAERRFLVMGVCKLCGADTELIDGKCYRCLSLSVYEEAKIEPASEEEEAKFAESLWRLC